MTPADRRMLQQLAEANPQTRVDAIAAFRALGRVLLAIAEAEEREWVGLADEDRELPIARQRTNRRDPVVFDVPAGTRISDVIFAPTPTGPGTREPLAGRRGNVEVFGAAGIFTVEWPLQCVARHRP